MALISARAGSLSARAEIQVRASGLRVFPVQFVSNLVPGGVAVYTAQLVDDNGAFLRGDWVPIVWTNGDWTVATIRLWLSAAIVTGLREDLAILDVIADVFTVKRAVNVLPCLDQGPERPHYL